MAAVIRRGGQPAAPAVVPNMHMAACTNPWCTGCYPDLPGVRGPARIPGPRRDADGLSVDQRRTRDNKALIAAGIHPATRCALAEEGSCGTCVHHHALHRGNAHVHKCDLHRLGMSHSAASDVRVGWPACSRWEAAP